MSKDGYKANKKKESVTPLFSGLYNVTSNYPIMLDLVKTKDERKAFMDFVKNKDKFKNNIFVFDRGYVSGSLFKFMSDGIRLVPVILFIYNNYPIHSLKIKK